MRKIGKYKLLRRLGEGGFAHVYKALDTVEGVAVAIKVPHPQFLSAQTLEDFRREIRLIAKLDHPNVLPLKNAELVDGALIVAFPLGNESLGERLRRRLSADRALEYAEQLLEALAYAHGERVIHCDVKPENLILFSDDRLRLTDFGIARVALRTVSASGSGSVGYVAPEQALGRPSYRSDVFSAGLVLWRMFAGVLPTWPFETPLPGQARIKRALPPSFLDFLYRAVEVDERRRFADADAMLAAFRRLLPGARRFRAGKARKRGATRRTGKPAWPLQRRKEFLRRYRKSLRPVHACVRCEGPVAEAMQACPWCGVERREHDGTTHGFPARCDRCGRGRKADWRFCAWCYGPGFDEVATREYDDRRYAARCAGAGCTRRLLMPFMRYCPWCRRKVRRAWKLDGSGEKCGHCGWGVARSYWEHCPWCARRLR